METIEVHVRSRAGPTAGALAFTRLEGRTLHASGELTLTLAASDSVAALKRAVCERSTARPALDPDALLLFLVRTARREPTATGAMAEESGGARGRDGQELSKHMPTSSSKCSVPDATSEEPSSSSYGKVIGLDDADDERTLAEIGVTHGATVELVYPRPGLVQLVVEFRMARTTSIFVCSCTKFASTRTVCIRKQRAIIREASAAGESPETNAYASAGD